MRLLKHFWNDWNSCNIFLCIFIFMNAPHQSPSYSYLALGDSYTIGEMVKEEDNFPHQVARLLKEKGVAIQEPRIIAKTGWTTDELAAAIADANPKADYDFVTLLIGVNNQYRGRSVSEYKVQFEALLKQAIHFAKDNSTHVAVLSIPDWGVTPYAAGRNRQEIARQIDEYNRANREITERYRITYIDITPGTREAANDPSLVTEDGLHPSGKDYQRWAIKVANWIAPVLK